MLLIKNCCRSINTFEHLHKQEMPACVINARLPFLLENRNSRILLSVIYSEAK